jgi:hypothetical protein
MKFNQLAQQFMQANQYHMQQHSQPNQMPYLMQQGNMFGGNM